MQKTKYVTNKELLKEIHNSKKTFCYYSDIEKHSNYDVIVQNKDQITPELVQTIIEAKAKPRGKTPPVIVGAEQLVFRVMTHEHIPLDPDRKRKARNTDKSYARTNFPPFKHYMLVGSELVEVGRSHWKGDLETGEFCLDKGRINNALARMFILLVDRISRRGNWRNYCVDDQTEALTHRGWVSGDDLTTEDQILSLNANQLTWSSVKSIYRDYYDGKMFKMTVSGMDSLVTPGHKFVTKKGIKPVDLLLETDQIVLSGSAVADPEDEIYEDAFIQLVGWFCTEGSSHDCKDRDYRRLTVYQNEGVHADCIRNCFKSLNETGSESIMAGDKIVRFNINKDLGHRIEEVVDIRNGKALKMPFILSLSQRQRILLIDTMIDGDGHRSGDDKTLRRYTQKSQPHIDTFVALCTIAGIRLTVKKRNIISFGKPTTISQLTLFSDRSPKHSRVENIDFHGGKRSGSIKGRGKHLHPNLPTESYSGKIWCPETEFGSFMARRNGTMFITGNSYVDEMRCHALAQLSQMGLLFDESKSDNPFAFYTTAVNNCFTRILNLERRAQNIRDDMLIMVGAKPSYTRQIDHELEYRFPAEPVAKKVSVKRPTLQAAPVTFSKD